MIGALVRRLRTGLARYRRQPIGEVLGKISRYAVAAGVAPSRLRACDVVGQRARTVGRPLVDNAGRITIGDDLVMNCSYAPVHLATGPAGELAIGDGVFLNFGSVLAARTRVRIGHRVNVGPYCLVADSDVPPTAVGAARPAHAPESAPIEVGDDVWLGGRVTLLPGCRIGARSVIGAGSIVAGEIPPDVIAGGNPARVLRPLPARDR